MIFSLALEDMSEGIRINGVNLYKQVPIYIRNQQLEVVDTSIYLGTVINNNMNPEAEIKC